MGSEMCIRDRSYPRGLAEQLGVSFQAVSRWENSVTFPDITMLPLLANMFDVTVDYLLDVDTYNKEKEIPDLEVLFDLADLFKVFGDSTRIRIMFAISDNEMSVLSIAEALNMEQSTISHQLRVLRQNKLVRVRREGKQIYYTLDDDHVKKIIEMGLDHVLE